MYVYNLLWNSIATCIATYMECCMITTQCIKCSTTIASAPLCPSPLWSNICKLCLPRRALKGKHRGLQHPLFIRHFRRLPYAIESIVSGDFKEMLSRIVRYGLFLCTSLSAPHWPHCACLAWIALLVLMGCCVAIISTQCDVANFFFNCQLLIEWHCAKLWEWILIKLLNSFVYIAHTD